VIRKRGVVVRVRCDENCSLVASARIQLPGTSRSLGVVRTHGRLVANKRTTVRLKLSRSKLRSLRRALGRRRSTLRVRVGVRATDQAGNTAAAERTIRAVR
jgi:hypothetical protein